MNHIQKIKRVELGAIIGRMAGEGGGGVGVGVTLRLYKLWEATKKQHVNCMWPESNTKYY